MQLQRWIVPASVAAILISLAALTILVADNSAVSGQDAARQEPGQVEEPEAEAPEPAPQPEQPEPEGVEPEGLNPEGPGSEDGPLEEPEEPGAQGDPGGGQAPGDEDTPQPAVQPGPRTATIEIIGNSAYYCSAGIIGDPRTVEGRRPATYEVDVATGGTALETVMAACQKISPGGALGVNIIYDDEVVAQGETEDRLGTVAVSWSPLEEDR